MAPTVSETLSGEMVKETLIRTFLRAALEETGAQRGLLILSHSGGHRIAAEATRRSKTIAVRLGNDVAPESLLPGCLLDYVQRTRKSVVIDDRTIRTEFAGDPYVRQHKTGSILCLPLLSQTRVFGVLLLESELATGVFTPARVGVLTLVASLAASALENSRFCRDLRQREAKIRRLVDANIVGIYIVDIRGPILESNNAYLHMLGYERADFMSGRLRWTDLTPPEWRTADAQKVEKVKRVGRLQPFEKEFFRKEGTRVPVLLGVARFKEPKTQAVVFAHGMSEQKRNEATALESRMIEQMRFTRKLHHGLLQNFQGILFRFQAARNLMPRQPEEALRSLNDVINEGENALDESRDAIQDLRFEPIAKGISGSW